jgi:hypothetical protein
VAKIRPSAKIFLGTYPGGKAVSLGIFWIAFSILQKIKQNGKKFKK